MAFIYMSTGYVCSYFDGDLPEKEKQKIKSEETEEDVTEDQKEMPHKSQR